MVRIFKDKSSLQIVVEGVSSEFSSLLQASLNKGRVTVKNLSKNKVVFEDKWEKIRNEDYESFDTQQELENYLNVIFEEVILTDKKELDGLLGGLDFEAYYIIAKN